MRKDTSSNSDELKGENSLEAQYDILSPYFSNFLVRKLTKYHAYSYISQKESIPEKQSSSDEDEHRDEYFD